MGIHFKARLEGTLRENRKTLSKPIDSAKSTNMWGHYCYLGGSPGNLYCYRKCKGHYCMKIATLQSVVSSYHLYTLYVNMPVVHFGDISTCFCLFSFPAVFPMVTHISTCTIFLFFFTYCSSF